MGRNSGSNSKKRGSERNDRPNVEVLIAHDPMLYDSDDGIDIGGSVVPAASFSRDRDRGDSMSSSSAGSSQKKERKKRDTKKKKKEAEVNEDGVDNEEVFYVEMIKDKRWSTVNNRWEYKLQWQGYGPEFDTWEPTENMDCDDLLKEFEEAWGKKVKYGFDRGQTAREIVALCLVKKKPMFLVLYKGSDDAEYVPLEECSKQCPSLVISFYERRQIALPGDDLDSTDDNSSLLPLPPTSGSAASSSTLTAGSVSETQT